MTIACQYDGFFFIYIYVYIVGYNINFWYPKKKIYKTNVLKIAAGEYIG